MSKCRSGVWEVNALCLSRAKAALLQRSEMASGYPESNTFWPFQIHTSCSAFHFDFWLVLLADTILVHCTFSNAYYRKQENIEYTFPRSLSVFLPFQCKEFRVKVLVFKLICIFCDYKILNGVGICKGKQRWQMHWTLR